MTERLILALAIIGGVVLVATLVRRIASNRAARVAASATIDTADQPRLMLFTSTHCDACDRQKGVVEGLRHAWQNRVAISYVDAVEQSDLARSFGIMVVPAVVVAAPDGRVVGIRQGLVDADRLRSLIETAA